MKDKEPVSGIEIIRENAKIAQSGVVFDRASIESGVPRTIELLQHLPESLQAAIRSGKKAITVDLAGNFHPPMITDES